jgi:CBS domain-containing protein
MKVAEVMTSDVEVASPDDLLQTAAQLMADADTGMLPVCNSERLVGVLTDRDVVVRAVAEAKSPAECTVSEVMTGDIRYCFADDESEDVARKMGEWQVHRLPVLDQEKRLVGIVSLGDLALEAPKEARVGKAMNRIVAGSRRDRAK